MPEKIVRFQRLAGDNEPEQASYQKPDTYF